MKILVVGGGSGGHVTPAVAVVREIIKSKPRAGIEFWTDFKYYKNVTKLTTEIGVAWGEDKKPSRKTPYIRVRRLPAGKFHRYSNWTFKDYFVNFDTTLKDLIFGNILGFFGFFAGLITSFFRLFPKEKASIANYRFSNAKSDFRPTSQASRLTLKKLCDASFKKSLTFFEKD